MCLRMDFSLFVVLLAGIITLNKQQLEIYDTPYRLKLLQKAVFPLTIAILQGVEITIEMLIAPLKYYFFKTRR